MIDGAIVGANAEINSRIKASRTSGRGDIFYSLYLKSFGRRSITIRLSPSGLANLIILRAVDGPNSGAIWWKYFLPAP
jgi:hypothetical protein